MYIVSTNTVHSWGMHVEHVGALGIQRKAILILLEPQFPHLSDGCVLDYLIFGVLSFTSVTLSKNSVTLGVKIHLASTKILCLKCPQVIWREESIVFYVFIFSQSLIL